MKVHVVCKNDFPESAWADEEAAKKHAAEKNDDEIAKEIRSGCRRSFYHLHTLDLQGRVA